MGRITAEWLKENGWNCYGNTSNKRINGKTYYLVCEKWCVYSRKSDLGQQAFPDAFIGDGTYTLCRNVAVISSLQALEMLTTTGKEFEDDTVVPLKDSDDVISRSWLPEHGWRPTLTGDYCRCIDGVWYEMEYTDFDCDYILKKEIARLETIDELEALIK